MLLLCLSAGVPSPPVELHVTGASRDFLAIAWKPPLRDGGCPISGYHIEMCEAGTEKWMRVNSRPVKELNYRVEEGVVPEKEYILRVRAINSVGVSEPSDISENVFAKESDCELLLWLVASHNCRSMKLAPTGVCVCVCSQVTQPWTFRLWTWLSWKRRSYTSQFHSELSPHPESPGTKMARS